MSEHKAVVEKPTTPSPNRPEPWASLEHQSLARPIRPREAALADALEAIYIKGVTDFAEITKLLSERGIVAPASGSTHWTPELLEQELATINASLDEAYSRDGIGA